MQRVATQLPINKTAALVTGKGTHFDPVIKPSCYATTDIRPRLRPVPKNTLDLTGVRFGRFVVVGLPADLNDRWVVKCDCGNYEHRRAKAIRNLANNVDRCNVCRKTHYILKGKDINDHR